MNQHSLFAALAHIPALAARALIRAYQLSLSSLAGGQCRYLPTCSAYMDEAIAKHGMWAGGWLGLSRLCRCHPWGASGFDPVPVSLPAHAHWTLPWRYGRWRSPLLCEPLNVVNSSFIVKAQPFKTKNASKETQHDRGSEPQGRS